MPCACAAAFPLRLPLPFPRTLAAFVAGEIVMSYFLLLFYAYSLIGPWPINDIRVYYAFFAVWTAIMILM